MLYLIRFDVRSRNHLSLSELREAWHRAVSTTRDPAGSGITESFKVVGRSTIFAVAEFPDNEALDEALARLPFVEDSDSAVEIEVIPVRPFDEPGISARTPAETEEPAGRRGGIGGRVDLKGREPAGAEEPVEAREADEKSEKRPEVGQLTGAIQSLDRPERKKSAEHEEAGQITGLVRGLDTPGRTPEDRNSVAPEETRPDEPPEQPEGSITGMIRGSGTPGRAPVEPGESEGSEGTGEKPASAEPSAARVLLWSDSQGEISVESDLVSLGRDSDNHVVVADPKASRHHALIRHKEGTYWIDDLGSQNGTRVNERLVDERRPLEDGAVIRIGDTHLVFGAAKADEREDPTQPEDPSVTGMIQSLEADEDGPRG